MNGLDKELWDSLYNGQRFSIEALHMIEIKKRGKGPDKKHFKDYRNDSGPYYDPQNDHVHVWKNSSELMNFIGPQQQTCSYVNFTDIKEGLYCGICHCEKKMTSFNFNFPNHTVKNTYKVSKVTIKTSIYSWVKIIAKLRYSLIYKDSIFPWKINNWRKLLPKVRYLLNKKKEVFPWQTSKNQKQLDYNPEYKLRWDKIIKKLKYTSENQKIVYQVSKYKSLLLWPWELTPYQKFKLSNKDYKDSCIFIKLKNFEDNYAIIV